MTAPEARLTLVATSDLPDPPYSPDIRSRGWGFTLDLERIQQSDTWTLAPADVRPWLLMLWITAWGQSPAGTLPPDNELIAAKMGMQLHQFDGAKSILLRNWTLHSDGRLYHDVLTECVLEMISKRTADKNRQAAHRARNAGKKKGGRVPAKITPVDKIDGIAEKQELGSNVTRESRMSHATVTVTGTVHKKTFNTSCPFPENQNREKDAGEITVKKRKLSEEAVKVLEYLNLKAKRGFKPGKGSLKHICARLREGVTVDECKLVIDDRVRLWLGDAKMAGWLKPDTLFNEVKFPSYQGMLGTDTTHGYEGKYL